MRKRQTILTPHGYQVARRDEFKAAVKTLKKLYPYEPKEEIERVVWSFVMGRPTRSRDELVELAIGVLGTTPTPSRQHSTKKLNRIQATYVKLKDKRGFDAYAVQLPADNQWGFELAQAEGEWSQSWPGGFGLATEWTAIPKTKVPAKVRSEMDWLFGA